MTGEVAACVLTDCTSATHVGSVAAIASGSHDGESTDSAAEGPVPTAGGHASNEACDMASCVTRIAASTATDIPDASAARPAAATALIAAPAAPAASCPCACAS
eukprot:scaffold5145_cov99-Isochrysis_galbana.AAC.4